MVESIEYDLVICGSGLAGLRAAIEATKKSSIGSPDTRCRSMAFSCDSVKHNTAVGDLKRYHFCFGPPDSPCQLCP